MLTVDKINSLPKSPGVYKFYDEDKNLLYIGKATKLILRVKSYFSASIKNKRIALLVSQIKFIEYIITETEREARILENNLILLLKPQFNILSREEENFPVIEITNHLFPQIKLTTYTKATGKIYGPYSTKQQAKDKVQLVQKLYKLRSCEDREFRNRTSPCFEYQLKQCSAPCINLVTNQEYQQKLSKAELILNCKYQKAQQETYHFMLEAATQENYEEASIYRDIYQQLKQFELLRLIPARNKLQSFDVILHTENSGLLFVYFLIIRNGVYIGDNHIIYKLSSNVQETLSHMIKTRYLDYYQLELIYIDLKLPLKLRQSFTTDFGIKVAVIDSINSNPLRSLIISAKRTLSGIINEYNYKNLFQGSINQLMQIFSLDAIDNIYYLNLGINRLSYLHWQQAASIKLNYEKSFGAGLKEIVLAVLAKLLVNKDNTVFFIKAEADIESIVIECLQGLACSANILLVKPIKHQSQVIIRLNKDFSYSIKSLIDKANIRKLVKILDLEFVRGEASCE